MEWFGAPPELFCAPKSKVPKAPRWAGLQCPWCPDEGWRDPSCDDLTPLETPPFQPYWDYVNSGGKCRDYVDQAEGGWSYDGGGCNSKGCPNTAAPNFDQPDPRTDVEGCCWWGRGAIQTTGICNFGKLNYYMGKRGHTEGRSVLYPAIDFCKNP